MMKTDEKIMRKELIELQKRKKQKNKPLIVGYSIIIAIIVSLIHIVDETISNIGGSIQSNVITEFFIEGMGLTYAEGLSKLSFLGIFSLLVSFISPVYKTLADRIGRKPLLAMNVLGFSVGMAICFVSNNYVVYIIGIATCSFFTSHDMQVTYILETAPADKRARYYGITKGIGTVGCVMLPIIRDIFMGNDPTKWRMIFIVPGLLGIMIALLVIFFARETDVFIDKRIATLEIPLEVRRQKANSNKKEKVGIGVGFKYIFKHSQLKWLVIIAFITSLPTLTLSGLYQSIMHTSGMSTADITQALYVYPFVFGGIIFLGGMLADKIGRKIVVIASGIITSLTYILFIIGCANSWSPFVIGGLYAIYLACFWASGDYRSVMANELAPTRIRFSVTGALGLVSIGSVLLGSVINSICVGLFDLKTFCLVFALPCIIIGTLMFVFKVKETNGVDLHSIEE